MMAAMVFTNLLYLVGAIAAATLVSALIVFRHRKPKSLEAGIELFTLEMQALAPESRSVPPGADRDDFRRSGRSLAGPGRQQRGGTSGHGDAPTSPGRPTHLDTGSQVGARTANGARPDPLGPLGPVGPVEEQPHSSGREAVGPPEKGDQAG